MFLFMAIFTLLSMRILKTKIMNFFPIQTLKYEKTILLIMGTLMYGIGLYVINRFWNIYTKNHF
jgi:hypothetical protein